MTTTLVSANITNTQQTLNGDDVFILPEAFSITNTGRGFNLGGNENQVFLYGDVFSTDEIALRMDSTVIGNEVYIGEHATVFGGDSSFVTVVLRGTDSSMVNHGAIVGNSFDAVVAFLGDSNLFVNHGDVDALRGSAVRIGFSGATSSDLGLINHGSITSSETAINILNTSDAVLLQNFGDISGLTGVFLDLTAQLTLENHGIITGTENAVDLTGDNSTILNTGTLSGTTSVSGQNARITNSGSMSRLAIDSGVVTAILVENLAGGVIADAIAAPGITDVTLRNAGEIAGTVGLGSGIDIVTNAGQIFGDVSLGAEDDFYRGLGSGLVSGEVSGGDNNDTLIGGSDNDSFDGGNGEDLLVGHGGDDTIDAGFGNDLVLGGDGNDVLLGSVGTDTLNGGAGSDDIQGGSESDILVGQEGSDTLDGGEGADIMDGGNGDDVLEGGSGNDILRGRAGEDDLAGGLGLDLLTGGQDADNFVFRSLAETAVGANRDQILDFEQGLDTIVVAGLSPGVFEFRGTSPFAPSGNPELRLFETPTGSTIVQLDNNGDGTQDAEIRVANITGLTAQDFVL